MPNLLNEDAPLEDSILPSTLRARRPVSEHVPGPVLRAESAAPDAEIRRECTVVGGRDLRASRAPPVLWAFACQLQNDTKALGFHQGGGMSAA